MKRVKLQIGLLAAVPMLAVVGFAALSVYEKVVERSHHAFMIPMTRIAEDSGNLIHEIQRERDKTVAFINSDYSADARSVLNAQRPRTDAKLKVFDEHLASLSLDDQELLEDLQHVAEEVHKIDKFRQEIDGQNLSADEAISNYSKEIE